MTDDEFWDEPGDGNVYGLGENIGKMKGRYHYPDPPGYVREKGEAAGFMRMTNLAAAFSDQIRLQKWRERMILLGIRTEEGEVLYDELMAEDLDHMDPMVARKFLESMADRMANAAGAGQGARRGTARHTMLQAMQETGVLTGTRTMKLQYHSLMNALERHHLEPIPGWSERRVCNTTYGVMGTLDLGVRCTLTGATGILDLKTQRGFWTYQEIAGQQYGYDSAQWVWAGPHDPSGRWEAAPKWDAVGLPGTEFAGRRVAYLAHMPQAPGDHQFPVEIHEVCLDYGHEVMVVARENVRLRSIGKSVKPGRRIGALRATPTPVRSHA